MKRIKIVGLCVVAVCAFAAVAGASTASAAHFNVCVAQKKGEYTTSSCTTKSVKAHKGTFEKKAASACVAQKKGEYTESACATKSVKAHKGKFEKVALPSATLAGTNAELKSAAGTIKCTGSKGTEQLTSSTTVTATTTFTGCQVEGAPCQNEGPEVIKTEVLKGVLVEPSPGVAHVDLTPNAGSYLAVFTCTGVAEVKVHGKLGGVLAPLNSFSTTHTVAFEEGVEQELLADFCVAPGKCTTLPSIQIAKLTITGSQALEIATP